MSYCQHCGNKINAGRELTPLEQDVLELNSQLADVRRQLRIMTDKLQPVYEEFLKHEEEKVQRGRTRNNP